jgi:mannose/fructose/N-acetylgalactosamine-specific phosphotransferase system component IIB
MDARPAEINVGGMHYEEGKRKLLPYLYVDEEDVLYLRRLIERGISVRAQDVPGAASHDLRDLLGNPEDQA